VDRRRLDPDRPPFTIDDLSRRNGGRSGREVEKREPYKGRPTMKKFATQIYDAVKA
jgi:hypothetical protein